MLSTKLMLFSIVTISLVGCAPSIKNLDSKGEAIVCFGNSITKGEGAAAEEAYPKVLEKLIGKEIINAGFGGDTTASALNRIEEDVLSKNPFLVIVELGGNDYLQQIPREVTVKNLEQIITKIQEKGVAVALCDISSGIFLYGYRTDFAKLAKKRGCILIPQVLGGILDDPAKKADNIHPNKDGYALIAQRVYKEIKKYFKLQQ